LYLEGRGVEVSLNAVGERPASPEAEELVREIGLPALFVHAAEYQRPRACIYKAGRQ
jgi:hypothetical protein